MVGGGGEAPPTNAVMTIKHDGAGEGENTKKNSSSQNAWRGWGRNTNNQSNSGYMRKNGVDEGNDKNTAVHGKDERSGGRGRGTRSNSHRPFIYLIRLIRLTN